MKYEKPIHILQLISHLTCDSGVANIIMNYYRYIDRSKVQFDFLYFMKADEAVVHEIQYLGGNVYQVPKPGLSIDSYYEWENFFSKHGEKYDIIHNNEVYLTALLYPFIKKYTHAKFIMHSHSTKWSDKELADVRNHILIFPSYYCADAFWACSKAAWNFTYNRFLNFHKYKKSYIVHNAIDLQKFNFNPVEREKMRMYYGISNNTFVVGHIGRFTKEKNHKFLIQIFQDVIRMHPDSKLVLLGEGKYQQDIKELIGNNGLENSVMLMGSRSDANRFYQMMDIFVLPSLFEGLPMVGVEAEAAGLPVIFSSVITREIDIVNACFLNLKITPGKWAEKILLYSDFHRVDTTNIMAQAGFDISIEAENLLNEYQNLLRRKND